MAGPTTGADLAKAGEGGFTLIEVLIAFAIAAIMLLALLEGMTRGMRGIAAAEARLDLLAHAENVMARVGSEIALEPGWRRGEFDGVAYEISITPSGTGVPSDIAADLGMDLLAISVTVRDEDGREQILESLRLVSLAP